MKTTLSWLQDFIDTNASLTDICEKLSSLGLVVEDIHDLTQGLKDFCIVEVQDITQHPDADRLKVCQVWTGEETLQVVCGGVNVRSGMKAVLAKPGMTVPTSGVTLKKTRIRGVESCGMLCSASELGIGEDPVEHGILDLAVEAPVGSPYVDYLGLNDPVLDLDVTPNRGDCLSALGIARELHAGGVGSLKQLRDFDVSSVGPSPISVEIHENSRKSCPVFMGRVLKGVQNCESPDWLQKKLRLLGVTPKSALVDITNYTLHSIGRPMHAYDLDKVEGPITVRSAQEGEKLDALDDMTYSLKDGMTVIADAKGPLALGGIIGGVSSGCHMGTQNVFLESAYFDPVDTALAGRSTTILTDSRYRFERGVDPDLLRYGLDSTTQFILDHCGGEAYDVVMAGSPPYLQKEVSLRYHRVSQLIGHAYSPDDIERPLRGLGFEILETTTEALKVRTPSWRHDISEEADLIEEVVRIHGYDKLPNIPFDSTENISRSQEPTFQNHLREIAIHRALGARSGFETLTWSFVKEEDADLFGGVTPSLRLENPISQDLSHMRPSLLPHLLRSVRQNQARGLKDNFLYEVGRVYEGGQRHEEVPMVSGVRAGDTDQRHVLSCARKTDAYDAKGDVYAVLKACGYDPSRFQIQEGAPLWYHPGRSATLQLGPKNKVAYFGELHPKITEYFDLEGPVNMFEVKTAALPLARKKKPSGLDLSPYQPLTRDFAFLLDEDVPASQIYEAIFRADRSLIQDMEIFDIYTGDGIAPGKKSVALTVTIQPRERTLNETDLTDLSEKIRHQMKKSTGGELRQ